MPEWCRPRSIRAEGTRLIGTALYGAVRRVVWYSRLAGQSLSQSRGPDCARVGIQTAQRVSIVELWRSRPLGGLRSRDHVLVKPESSVCSGSH